MAFDQPGNHLRDAIGVPFERAGPTLHVDRHGWPAPQGQGVRSRREVLCRQDAAGHPDALCVVVLLIDATQGVMTRTPTSRAMCSKPVGPW